MSIKSIITILTALTVLTTCSCSGKKQESEWEYNSAKTFDALVMEESSLQTNEPISDKVETVDRKIIKEGEIKFKTTDVNKTKSLIVQTLRESNGYISKDNAYDYSDRFEHLLIIRVPADKFDLVLNNISENVDQFDSKNIDVLDVTEEYIDIEARIKTKKELQKRYIDILKQARNVSEMLEIEREIGNLQTEIESVEGRIKYLKDEIAFSTLTITYYQTTASKFGFSSKFVDGIKNGWSSFLWFIIGLSNLWVFILIAIATVYIIIRWRKKKKISRKSKN
jgi:hypothetical protein